MERKMSRERGFTLIELVLVIALLGILASVGLPKFFTINETAARNNARTGVVGAVRTGLVLYAAKEVSDGNSVSYPTNLEASPGTGTPCNPTTPCFDSVIASPVVDGVWKKVAAKINCYEHADTVVGSSFYDYISASGQFKKIASAGVCL